MLSKIKGAAVTLAVINPWACLTSPIINASPNKRSIPISSDLSSLIFHIIPPPRLIFFPCPVSPSSEAPQTFVLNISYSLKYNIIQLIHSLLAPSTLCHGQQNWISSSTNRARWHRVVRQQSLNGKWTPLFYFSSSSHGMVIATPHFKLKSALYKKIKFRFRISLLVDFKSSQAKERVSPWLVKLKLNLFRSCKAKWE